MLTLAGVVAALVKVSNDAGKCDKQYTELQLKYDTDTKPLQFQVSDFKKRAFDAEDKAQTATTQLEANQKRLTLLEKNVIGKFEKEPIVGKADNSCVSLADGTKGDFSYLQLNTLCKNQDKLRIFTYDPVYKQLIVDLGQQKRCVDAVNENDIVLNECIRTSQKQKFNYFPLYGGRFKSMLYSKCLGHNADTNIIELQQCGDVSNVVTRGPSQASHLFLENN